MTFLVMALFSPLLIYSTFCLWLSMCQCTKPRLRSARTPNGPRSSPKSTMCWRAATAASWTRSSSSWPRSATSPTSSSSCPPSRSPTRPSTTRCWAQPPMALARPRPPAAPAAAPSFPSRLWPRWRKRSVGLLLPLNNCLY